MRPYTTPTLYCTVKKYDITDADIIWVTISDGSRTKKVRKVKTDVVLRFADGKTEIDVPLSQEETGMFPVNSFADVEVNWWFGNKRGATKIKRIRVTENLEPEVYPIDGGVSDE